MCGVVLRSTMRRLSLCDFYGEMSMFKDPQITVQSGSCVLLARLFEHNSKLALFCFSVRNTSLYEEIAFNAEVNSLEKLNRDC